MNTHPSLNRRLLALALGTVVAVWLAATTFTYQDARHEFNEVLDAHLAQAASLLIAQASRDLDEIETEHAPLLHKYSRSVAFQVWQQGKQLRLHSANAPQQHLATVEQGFSDNSIAGERWRVFSSWDDAHEYLVQVAERTEVRDELAQGIAGNLLLPLLVSLPLLALLLWLAVTRGLRPLLALTRDIEQRDPGNLAPLEAGAVPREVLPLVERLNRLFARIASSMQKERRFTADAAHELRTPVAAIKAQAQVARGASTDAERVRALDNAILGCDRAAHLIEQLLMLARVDTLAGDVLETCQLHSLAAEAIAALAPAALEKGVQLELHTDEAIALRGNPALLRVLLNNLLDNAIKHTAPGTVVQVGISHAQGIVCMTVSDNGPGIAAEECERVLERFYRPAGTQASGSGLGLSIVKRIAELHHADLQLLPGSADRGLSVTVKFRK